MTAAERAQRRAELRERYRRGKVAELEAAGQADLAQEVLEGRCACGCGRRLDSGAVRQFYLDEKHKQRAHRKRLELAAEAAGVPARLTLEALQSSNRTRDRHGDAPARPKRPRRPRPGVTIYLPTAELADRARAELAIAVDAGVAELAPVEEAIAAALERRRKRAA